MGQILQQQQQQQKKPMMVKFPNEDLSSRRASFLLFVGTFLSQATKRPSLVHPEGDTLKSPERRNRRPLKSRKGLMSDQITFNVLSVRLRTEISVNTGDEVHYAQSNNQSNLA